MAELTLEPSPDGVFGTKVGSKFCKLPALKTKPATAP